VTITLRPEQEKVIQKAIETGMYNSVEEVLDSALESPGFLESGRTRC
jgi:hypothetical protein